jgi:S-adenosyl methyltransferase
MSEIPAEMSELPSEIDITRPHPARMYDYFLGGKNHFAADRETAETVLAAAPTTVVGARENRAFLGRAVRYLVAEAGVRQFLDIGTGLPTTNNVHDVAQAAEPTVRVVYADNDPLVLAHARALLTSSREGRTAYIQADLRDPAAILGSPVVREVLDFSQPIALMTVAVLHFIQDESKPAAILATLLDALPSGSYLTASHVTGEHLPTGAAATTRTYRSSGVPLQVRDSDEFARLAFDGLDLVPPGVVLVSEWRPDTTGPRPAPSEVNVYGGVARKPLCTAAGHCGLRGTSSRQRIAPAAPILTVFYGCERRCPA